MLRTAISRSSLSALLLLGFWASRPERCAADPPLPDPQRPARRARAREIGIHVGVLEPGALNAITDVAGVRVGHQTIVEGEAVRTGVTAIVPHPGNVFQEKVPAAIIVGNGFGKLVGSTQVEELATLETPVVLTNTLSVFAAADAVVAYTLNLEGNETVTSVNPVVGETNDGYLNDIRARRVRRGDVLAAIAAAKDGPVEEGSVGAGTGTRCMGWKGGIGTASRRLPESAGGHTVGVLAQTNFGGILTVNGAPVGRELGRYYLQEPGNKRAVEGGSCMLVVATDAPLDGRQLKRLAKRALLGLAAVGSPMTHGSGDYVIAFSTAEQVRIPHQPRAKRAVGTLLRDEALSPLFQAARETTEEAILNSLLKATTVAGFQGHKCEAIPVDRVVQICRRYGAIHRQQPAPVPEAIDRCLPPGRRCRTIEPPPGRGVDSGASRLAIIKVLRGAAATGSHHHRSGFFSNIDRGRLRPGGRPARARSPAPLGLGLPGR